MQLIFEAPTNKKLKFLHLKLPAAAFHADGPMICYEINPSDIRSEAAKSTAGGQGRSSDEADEGDVRARGPAKATRNEAKEGQGGKCRLFELTARFARLQDG